VQAFEPVPLRGRAEEGVRPYTGFGNHFAHDLVAGDNAWLERTELAFDDVQVGAADPASADAKEDLAGLRRRNWVVFDSKRMVCD
jgi:hypothetical protein